MSETINYVLGNPFVTFKGVHYVAKNDCEDGLEDGSVNGALSSICDPPSPSVSKKPEDIEFINRQLTAIDKGLTEAQNHVKRQLIAANPSSPEVRIIAEDQFALPDLVKKGDFHPMFNRRFSRATQRSISDCGNLVSDIRHTLQVIMGGVKLFTQFDHSGNVKEYLLPEEYEVLALRLAGSRAHGSFKQALISEGFLQHGLTLADVLPEVSRPFELSLDSTIFSKDDVSILFERVIRDHLARMARNLEWDEEININPETGKPFYDHRPGEFPRNVVNFPKPDKPVIACLGVVSGVPTLIAHQSPGSRVQMFMEPDPIKRRVDRDIIKAGLAFYNVVIAQTPHIPADAIYPFMVTPEPVVSELFMTSVGTEQVPVGLPAK